MLRSRYIIALDLLTNKKVVGVFVRFRAPLRNLN
jgi:hypothetical protein